MCQFPLTVPNTDPRLNKPRQFAHLEDWCEIGGALWGIVSGHPTMPDGKRIRTSSLLSLNPDAGLARTDNTDYTLGEPIVL